MKKNALHIPVTLFAVFLIIWLIPGFCSSHADRIVLSGVSVGTALIFIAGTRRIRNGLNVSQSRFNALWFGTMAIRMFIALIFIIIFLVFSGVSKLPGVLLLICQYFIYMGFEIRSILPKLRTDSEKTPKSDDARK